MFEFLENHNQEIINLDNKAMEKVVHDSVTIKSKIVNIDEKEAGARRKLNFGHTLGHAIEKTKGLSHGEAISLGMVFAARLSATKQLLSKEELNRLINLLKLYELPTEIDVEKEEIIDAIRMDKKRGGEEIYCILLKSLGEAMITKIPLTEWEEHIHDLC
jgi:3-dehydroquinate synthase